MKLTKELKAAILYYNIKELLQIHRYYKGDPEEPSLFEGESGAFFIYRMNKLREQDNEAYVKASKEIGWTL